MTTTTGYATEARSYSRKASAATRRAQRDAEFAASQYESAANWIRHARWLTAHAGDLSRWGVSPAEAEATAVVLIHLADTFLRSSFNDDKHAVDYREFAARYRKLAAEQAARMADYAAECSAQCWAYDCDDCPGSRADGGACKHFCHGSA